MYQQLFLHSMQISFFSIVYDWSVANGLTIHDSDKPHHCRAYKNPWRVEISKSWFIVRMSRLIIGDTLLIWRFSRYNLSWPSATACICKGYAEMPLPGVEFNQCNICSIIRITLIRYLWVILPNFNGGLNTALLNLGHGWENCILQTTLYKELQVRESWYTPETDL